MRPVFVTNSAQLIESVITFMEAPELWRPAVGAHPKYFVHYELGQKHYFGLSKYCALKDITLTEYVHRFRHETGGGSAQKRIRRISGKSWIPLNRADRTVRSKFKTWFFGFFSRSYNLNEVSVISLDNAIHVRTERKARPVSVAPDVLAKKLARQELIGAIGEEIAYQYEVQRLANLGVPESAQWVEQVSKRNAAAGFDISSIAPRKDRRYIEVKSHTIHGSLSYITRNQIETLRTLAAEAYLYLVHVTDTRTRKGRVIEEIRNPVAQLEARGQLNPILYEAEFLPAGDPV